MQKDIANEKTSTATSEDTSSLISIIIPAYNSEEYLHIAIESALRQTYKYFEIIIVDDGSTDNTTDIAKSYADKHSDKIFYFHQDNGGVSSARNLGLTKIKGEYIAFLDADDFWHEDKIKWQVECFKNYPTIDLCHTKVEFNAQLGSTNNHRIIRDPKFEYRDFIELFKNPYLATSSVMLKASMLKDLGGFDESLKTAEDIDLYLRSTFNKSYGYINEILCYKVFNPNSLSESEQSYLDNLKVLDNFLYKNPTFKRTNSNLTNIVYSTVLHKYGNYQLSIGRINESRNNIIKSLKYHPSFKSLKLLTKTFLPKLIREWLWSKVTHHQPIPSKQPLVTVILPVYNAETHLAEAVNSILSQTYNNFKLLAIDDGSNDHSLSILQTAQQKDNRVQIITRPNRGLIATLNEGIDLAEGKYIARMDADDISLPKRLEKQVQLLESQSDVGICGCMYKFTGASNDNVHVYLKHDYIATRLLFGVPFAHPSVMFRKSLFDENNLRYSSNYIHCEDYELWTRCIKLTKFSNVEEHLFLYRIHDSQISVVNKSITLGKHISISKKLLSEFDLILTDKETLAFIGKENNEEGFNNMLAMYTKLAINNKENNFLDQEALKEVLSAALISSITKFYGLDGLRKLKNDPIFYEHAKVSVKTYQHALKRSIKNTMKKRLPLVKTIYLKVKGK